MYYVLLRYVRAVPKIGVSPESSFLSQIVNSDPQVTPGERKLRASATVLSQKLYCRAPPGAKGSVASGAKRLALLTR
eukprot:scaffold80079_cov36-Tisochrysis_lutea.AAC.1